MSIIGSTPSAPMVVVGFDRQRLQSALSSAIAFLLTQHRNSGWADFNTPVGRSNQWVKAYVARSLLNTPDALGVLESSAVELIKEQRRNGGWGYNQHVPADADSTAIVLDFLTGFEESGATPVVRKKYTKSLRRAADFLCRHQLHDGGIATYRNTLRLRLVMRAFKVGFGGWTQSHTCVTAAAIKALQRLDDRHYAVNIRRGTDYLQRSVDKSTGLWSGYWWQGPYYPSAMALPLVSEVQQDKQLLETLIQNIKSLQLASGAWGSGGTGSVFMTALVLSMFEDLNEGNLPCVEKAWQWLFQSQNHDGSWPSSPIMRIPAPDECHPEDDMPWRIDGLGTGVLIGDHCRLFTTATVIDTLKRIDTSVALKKIHRKLAQITAN